MIYVIYLKHNVHFIILQYKNHVYNLMIIIHSRDEDKWDPGDDWGILTSIIVFQPFLISFFITCLSKYFVILDKNRKEPVKLEIKEVTGLM